MIDKLLEYQKIDSELNAIEREIGKSEEEKKYVSAKRFLKSVNTSLQMLDGKAGELANKYSALKTTYGKIKDSESEYDNIIDTCEDENELNYLAKKAQELYDKASELQKNIEKLVSDINSVVKDFNILKKNTQDAKRQYDEYREKYFNLIKSKKGAMDEIKSRLDKLKKDIDPVIMQKYYIKRKDKIFPVLFPINGKHCSACGTELSMMGYTNLMKNGIIECDYCRRLIYVEKTNE